MSIASTFWLVVFGISALGIWSSMARERERQQTIRAAIERGQQLDPTVLEKVMSRSAAQDNGSGGPQSWVQLMIGGIITLSVGPGLALMGVLIGNSAPLAYWPLLGAGALVATIGLGILVAALVWRSHSVVDSVQKP
jgi:hypothetical protein